MELSWTETYISANTLTINVVASSKLKMISAVANTEWGWRKEQLVRLYTTFIQSAYNCTGFAWMPCAAESHIARLEREQNNALRRITATATPTEALRKECGLISPQTEIKRLLAMPAEKAVRPPEDNPRRISFSSPVKKRINRDN